jgi:hypothetical protein
VAVDLQLFFAWVNPTDTTFNSSFARWDENVFSFELDGIEGQIPTLKIVVKNPQVGFIAPGRLYWAWFSVSVNGAAATPMFFGRLIGIPTDIHENTVEMQFIARPTDYIRQKQLVAENLKVSPNYDPIFFTVDKRDDPDAILEGWSSLYHVDRITNAVTVSDILEGEDGTIAFAGADTFYDSVTMKLGQSPLVAVSVQAEVSWQQQYRGWFYVGQWAYPTLGNEPVVQDWPKSGSALGGGWQAGISWAGEVDPSPAAAAAATLPGSSTSGSYSWKNLKRSHHYGDTMSIDVSWSYPAVGGSGSAVISEHEQIGIQAPFTTDAGGNPAPTNIPYHFDINYITWRTFDLHYLGKSIAMFLSLVYDANRKRSERIQITMQADVQSIIIDPLITEDTETISLKSGDLSIPMINFLNWDSVSGQAVAVGQIVFPDNPLVVGQTTSQIAVQAGTAGTVEPTFSNVAGQTTADGSVIWASLGVTQPTEGAQDWQRVARVGLGTMLLPKPISGAPDLASLEQPGAMQIPPVGVGVTLYEVLTYGTEGGPGAKMLECTSAGIAGGITHAQATFQTFINPSGKSLQICIQAGITGAFHVTWNETPGGQTTDGTVIWQCIGNVELAVGGWPGMTPAADYFPTTRGLQSVEHLICRGGAKLRKRARAVTVSADIRFEAALNISCRMNAVITSPKRLPGGAAAGKVIAYKFKGDGDTGQVIANVTIGCAIGHNGTPPTSGGGGFVPGGGHVPVSAGSATYAAPGYMADGYQSMFGAVVGVNAGGGGGGFTGGSPAAGISVGYTPPVPGIVDDGLVFPVSLSDVVLSQKWHGNQQYVDSLSQAAYNAVIDEAVQGAMSTHTATSDVNIPNQADTSQSVTVTTPNYAEITAAAQQAISNALAQGQALWYELVIKPVTGGPYIGAYAVDTTPLQIPKMIDLSASSA